jgi:hypothetical protein
MLTNVLPFRWRIGLGTTGGLCRSAMVRQTSNPYPKGNILLSSFTKSQNLKATKTATVYQKIYVLYQPISFHQSILAGTLSY